jgi:hydroxymethylpyrimidine/phosphomethylpyrimidine kinase
MRVVLTIAGSDPSGGAGLQADLKTFHRHGLFGTSAVSLLTVQNTVGVRRVEVLEPDLLLAQIDAVVADLEVAAAKTGALGSAATIEAVAARAESFAFPLVVDPVIVSKHGHPLLPAAAVAALRERLVPRAFVLTPNVHEAAALSGQVVDDDASMVAAGRALCALGAAHVVVKGGGRSGSADDVLVSAEGRVRWLRGSRIESRAAHGSGCVFSAALVAGLARGLGVEDAVRAAKDFVRRAIAAAVPLGRGPIGPLDTTVDAGRAG